MGSGDKNPENHALSDRGQPFQTTFEDRLKLVLDLFESRTVAAEVGGVGANQLARYLRGVATPPYDVLARLCAAKGISLDWLAASSQTEQPKMLRSPPANAVPVPLYSIRAGAGAYQLAHDEPPEHVRYLDRHFLSDLGVKPEHAIMVVADGPSMKETIDDGDPMLVDKSERDIRDDIFVMRRGDGILVKRLLRRSGGGVMLISDNKAFPVDELPRDEARDLQMIGRVRYVFKKL